MICLSTLNEFDWQAPSHLIRTAHQRIRLPTFEIQGDFDQKNETSSKQQNQLPTCLDLWSTSKWSFRINAICWPNDGWECERKRRRLHQIRSIDKRICAIQRLHGISNFSLSRLKYPCMLFLRRSYVQRAIKQQERFELMRVESFINLIFDYAFDYVYKAYRTLKLFSVVQFNLINYNVKLILAK